MNIKLTVLMLALLSAGLAGRAQENDPKSPPGSPPPAPAPAPTPDPAPTPTPPTEPTPAPTDPAPAQPAPAQPAPGQPAPTPPTPAEATPAEATPATTPATTPGFGVLPVRAAEPAPAPAAPAGAPAGGGGGGGGGGAAAANPNEPVPLIVIDDVPLTDAIRNLARQSNLNFQFDPRITASNQPNVSIRFENVTAQEALQAVLDNYNMTLVKDSKSKIARISVKDPKAEDPLVSRIIQLKYADPTNLVSLVKSTLSPRSQVVADARTSQLIVNTTEKELDGLMATIERLDAPTKQVLIEGRILETSKAPNSIRGIDWSGTVGGQNVKFGNNTVTLPPAVSDNKVLASTVPKLLVDTAKGFNPATAFLDADGVSAVISFLNKDTETEVVATPRAVTLDNQMATLSVTRAFPIFKTTPGSANSPAGSEITYTNLGVILYVTPRIAANDDVSLTVAPEVSNIDDKDRQIINGAENIANVYAIRRIETHVMIPNGHTLVMGGLINDTASKSYTKVPLLGDMPGLGALFRSSNKTRKKTNLLIFITPTVLGDGDFHVTSSGSEFLKTPNVEKLETEDSMLDSAKPHDWTRPAY